VNGDRVGQRDLVQLMQATAERIEQELSNERHLNE
jgi:hypothetical protein